jgi:cytochrome c oxidase subunit II
MNSVRAGLPTSLGCSRNRASSDGAYPELDRRANSSQPRQYAVARWLGFADEPFSSYGHKLPMRLAMLPSPESAAAFAAIFDTAGSFGSRAQHFCLAGIALFDQPSASLFAPHTTPARSIFDLSILVMVICGAIFVLVAGLLVFTLIRYRHRRGYTVREPAQIYGSTQVELSWTVIPILIVVVLFLATARVIFVTENAPKPASALDVVVIGHQYWWEFRYPKLGIVTANELHVPVSDPAQPTPTYLTMSSADTDHSFWVPRLGGKMDVLPNKVNTLWLDPDTAGLYLGQCAQYCGTQHAKMLLRVYADSPAAFASWVAEQHKPARQAPEGAEGRAVFQSNACVNCHTISGTSAAGRFGPDLSHVASRTTIASGAVRLNEENLHAFIDDPAHFKPGALMPAMHLNDHDLNAVTQYLMTLH